MGSARDELVKWFWIEGLDFICGLPISSGFNLTHVNLKSQKTTVRLKDLRNGHPLTQSVRNFRLQYVGVFHDERVCLQVVAVGLTLLSLLPESGAVAASPP